MDNGHHTYGDPEFRGAVRGINEIGSTGPATHILLFCESWYRHQMPLGEDGGEEHSDADREDDYFSHSYSLDGRTVGDSPGYRFIFTWNSITILGSVSL